MRLHPFDPTKGRIVRDRKLAVLMLISIVSMRELHHKIALHVKHLTSGGLKHGKKHKEKLKADVEDICGWMQKELDNFMSLDIDELTFERRAAGYIAKFGNFLKKHKALAGEKKERLQKSIDSIKDGIKKKKLEMNNLLNNVVNFEKISEELSQWPTGWVNFTLKKKAIEVGTLAEKIKEDKDNPEALQMDYGILAEDLKNMNKDTNLLIRRLLGQFTKLEKGLKKVHVTFPVLGKTKKKFHDTFKKIKKTAMLTRKSVGHTTEELFSKAG